MFILFLSNKIVQKDRGHFGVTIITHQSVCQMVSIQTFPTLPLKLFCNILNPFSTHNPIHVLKKGFCTTATSGQDLSLGTNLLWCSFHLFDHNKDKLFKSGLDYLAINKNTFVKNFSFFGSISKRLQLPYIYDQSQPQDECLELQI